VSSAARVVIAAIAVCGLGRLAAAEDNVGAATGRPLASAVEVRIGAVLASNSGKEFDQRLASMQQQFHTLFAYSSYRLVKEQRQQVAWGEKVGFDIPGGRYVVVIPKEFKDNRVLMKVMVIEGSRSIVDTALSLRNHATFLVGGPRGDNGVIILSIGADTVN
jgi:hypothetical protein